MAPFTGGFKTAFGLRCRAQGRGGGFETPSEGGEHPHEPNVSPAGPPCRDAFRTNRCRQNHRTDRESPGCSALRLSFCFEHYFPRPRVQMGTAGIPHSTTPCGAPRKNITSFQCRHVRFPATGPYSWKHGIAMRPMSNSRTQGGQNGGAEART